MRGGRRCPKESLKLRDVLELRVYLQKAETVAEPAAGYGGGREGHGCHFEELGFYSLGKVLGRWDVIIRFT